MIKRFRGEYWFLSNPFPCEVHYEDMVFDSSEYAFQAGKDLDPVVRRIIRDAPRWQDAKRLAGPGGIVTLRPGWEEGVKDRVMTEVLADKFTRHAHLQQALLATGDQELIEGNTWHDNYWGDCSCRRCQNIPGRNMLGRILMQIRTALREQQPKKTRS